MLPILGLDVPGFHRVLLDFLEALLLLLLADVQEELHDPVAVVGQCALEIRDVLVGRAPGLLGSELLDAFHQHTAVPAPVEDGDFSIVRNLLPESPEPGHVGLVGPRAADRVKLEAARFQPFGQGIDGGAFAGRVPAFEDDDGRDLGLPTCLLDLEQAVAQDGNALLVLLFRQPFLEIYLFEHGNPEPSYCISGVQRMCAGFCRRAEQAGAVASA